MPELHPNQIQWQSPEPVKAQLAKVQDTLSPQIEKLGQAAERLAETQAKIDDVEFSEKLKNEVSQGMLAIEQAKHSDANYEEERAELFNRVQATMDGTAKDVRVRFMRNNPEYLDNVMLQAESLILKKVQSQQAVDSELQIPSLASNVVQGLASYDNVKKQLEEMTVNLPPEVSARLLFKLDDEIARGNIENDIRVKHYKDADVKVDLAKTLTPSEKIRYKRYIQSTAEANAQAEAALQKKLMSGTKGDESAVKVQIANGIYRAWQSNNKEDALRIIRALETNQDIEIAERDEKGNVVSIGVINANDISPALAFEIARSARTAIESTDEWVAQNARAEADVSNYEAHIEQALKNKDDTGANYFSSIYGLKDYLDSPAGAFLSNGTRTRAHKLIYSNLDAKREAAIQPAGDMIVYTGLWRDLQEEEEYKALLDAATPHIMDSLADFSGFVLSANALTAMLPKAIVSRVKAYAKKEMGGATDAELDDAVNGFIAMATAAAARQVHPLDGENMLRQKEYQSLVPIQALKSDRWTKHMSPAGAIVNALEMPNGTLVSFDDPSIRLDDPASAALSRGAVATNMVMHNYLNSLPKGKQPKKRTTTAFLVTTAASILSAVGDDEILDAIGLPGTLTQDDILTAMERTWAQLESQGIDQDKITRDDAGTDYAMKIEKAFYDNLLPRGQSSRINLTPEQEQLRAKVFLDNRLDTLNGAGTLDKTLYVPKIEIKEDLYSPPTVLGARLAKEAKKK